DKEHKEHKEGRDKAKKQDKERGREKDKDKDKDRDRERERKERDRERERRPARSPGIEQPKPGALYVQVRPGASPRPLQRLHSRGDGASLLHRNWLDYREGWVLGH
ncbi:hypothetical protein TSOC_002581, partial [Tetrabaena socialis]